MTCVTPGAGAGVRVVCAATIMAKNTVRARMAPKRTVIVLPPSPLWMKTVTTGDDGSPLQQTTRQRAGRPGTRDGNRYNVAIMQLSTRISPMTEGDYLAAR